MSGDIELAVKGAITDYLAAQRRSVAARNALDLALIEVRHAEAAEAFEKVWLEALWPMWRGSIRASNPNGPLAADPASASTPASTPKGPLTCDVAGLAPEPLAPPASPPGTQP